jgi:predicted HTH transcriptional regulator
MDISKIEEVKTPDGMVFVVSITKNPDEVYVTEGAVLVRKGTPEYREWTDTTVTVLHPAEVIIAKEEIFLEGLSERQKKAIEYIKEKGTISRREYVTLANISLRQANKDLRDLLEKNLIAQIGKGRSVKYTMHD